MKINQLNPMQQEAQTTTEGPLLILAGAGSGKTRVLTHRMAFLVENGIDPYHILAITFTNKAANEMRQRVSSLIPGGDKILCCTFHSVCVRILRREITNLEYGSGFTIYDSDDSERLLKNCIKELNINDKQFPVKSVAQEIGRQKDELIPPREFEKNSSGDYRLSVISKIYSLYQNKLKTSNALDFDDIIFKTVELFITRPDILEKYQDRFRYISVDEYQDTNTAQYHLVRLLAQKHMNVCVVGDDDQSIYGWRGANIRNILDFEKDFANAASVKLEQNYRSGGIILDAANSVIKNNRGRKAKTLWTDREPGEKITFYKSYNEREEAEYIIKEIKQMVRKGGKRRDIAILYRMNSLSRSLEEQFIKSGVPYRIFGGINFYQRREIKDILAYLKLIANPSDGVAAVRIINVPRRGIGDTTIAKIQAHASQNGISLMDAMRNEGLTKSLGTRGKKCAEFVTLIDGLVDYSNNHSVSELLGELFKKTGFMDDLESNTENPEERAENVDELLSKAVGFKNNSDEISNDLAAFLEEVSLVADIDSYNESEEAVSLMTLHSAKGLEFECVFLAGFEEGIFPSYRAITSENRNAVEEERRLCYVGITRAKRKLYITAANSRMHLGQVTYNAVSRFFKEIPAKYVEPAF